MVSGEETLSPRQSSNSRRSVENAMLLSGDEVSSPRLSSRKNLFEKFKSPRVKVDAAENEEGTLVSTEASKMPEADDKLKKKPSALKQLPGSPEKKRRRRKMKGLDASEIENDTEIAAKGDAKPEASRVKLEGDLTSTEESEGQSKKNSRLDVRRSNTPKKSARSHITRERSKKEESVKDVEADNGDEASETVNSEDKNTTMIEKSDELHTSASIAQALVTPEKKEKLNDTAQVDKDATNGTARGTTDSIVNLGRSVSAGMLASVGSRFSRGSLFHRPGSIGTPENANMSPGRRSQSPVASLSVSGNRISDEAGSLKDTLSEMASQAESPNREGRGSGSLDTPLNPLSGSNGHSPVEVGIDIVKSPRRSPMASGGSSSSQQGFSILRNIPEHSQLKPSCNDFAHLSLFFEKQSLEYVE
jgi:hypothetical protein